MPLARPYPYLGQFFTAYFRRAADDDGHTDDDIIREFSDASSPHDVLGTRADSLRFLSEHERDRDFLASLYRNFQLELSSGATDTEARAWLARIETLLRSRQAGRHGPDATPLHPSMPHTLDDSRFTGAPGSKLITRVGRLGEHAPHSQLSLRLVATDPALLIELLYAVSLRQDCWSVSVARTPRAGMYQGQLWLQNDGAVVGLYNELEGHPRLMVSIQREGALDAARSIPLPEGSCRVRDEWPEHTAQVAAAHRQAFERADEAAIVEDVRAASPATISLVAQLAPDLRGNRPGPVVGHLLLSPVTLDGAAEPLGLGLGPIAVLPSHQRKGIGSRLIEAGLRRSRALGYGYVVVLGHPEYYPRFGFAPASRFGLQFEHPVPDEVFMALELVPGALARASGVVRYLPAFSGE